MRREAIFDTSARYRYRLTRRWDEDAPAACFVLLNPGTADAEQDDPTIRRCIAFARRWGFGALTVVNLFAYCTSFPKQLRQATDPIGPENDSYIQEAIAESNRVVVAWGYHGAYQARDQAVLPLASAPYCLGVTASGQPKHPLYIRADTTLDIYPHPSPEGKRAARCANPQYPP